MVWHGVAIGAVVEMRLYESFWTNHTSPLMKSCYNP